MRHLAQLALGPLGCLAGTALCMATMRRARPASRTNPEPAPEVDVPGSTKVPGSGGQHD